MGIGRNPRNTQLALLVVSLSSMVLSLGRTAWAAPPSKAACQASHGKSQELRLENKLLDAREELRVCADPACPSLLQTECGNWLVSVQQAIPSVLFLVESEDGKAANARISADGKPLNGPYDGVAFEFDPGVHAFRFELEGFPPIDQTVVVRQDEKRRVVRVQFEKERPPDSTPPGTSASTPASPTSSLEPTPTGPRPVPITTYVFGGLALASAGASAYFGVSGLSQHGDDEDTCAPNCDQSEIDDVKTKLLIADVAGGVAIVSAGLATYFYLTRPVVQEERTPAAWVKRINVSWSQDRAGVSFSGAF